MEDLDIKEDGSPDQLKEDSFSKIGKEIQDINLRNYTFMKKVSKKSKIKSPTETWFYLFYHTSPTF